MSSTTLEKISMLKISKTFAVSLLIFILSFISTLHAEIYKWTDENGKVHYSDKPIDQNATKVKEKSKLSEQYVNEEKRRAQKLISIQKRMEQSRTDKTNADNQKAIEKQNKQNKLKSLCRAAKRDVIVLGHGRPTYYEDDKGKRVFLSDDEKNTNIKKTQDFIKENCNF